MSVKNNSQRVFILVIVVVFFLTSVTATIYIIYDAARNNDPQSALQNQTQQEGNKLAGTKLTNYAPVEKVDQLQKIDLVPGTGAEAGANATVTAHYTGALAKDGTIFESSKDGGQPFTSPLADLIPGWQQGIPGMKAGGTRRLLIPANLAYGAQASEKIPANSDLIFDIELIETK